MYKNEKSLNWFRWHTKKQRKWKMIPNTMCVSCVLCKRTKPYLFTSQSLSHQQISSVTTKWLLLLMFCCCFGFVKFLQSQENRLIFAPFYLISFFFSVCENGSSQIIKNQVCTLHFLFWCVSSMIIFYAIICSYIFHFLLLVTQKKDKNKIKKTFRKISTWIGVMRWKCKINLHASNKLTRTQHGVGHWVLNLVQNANLLYSLCLHFSIQPD